MSLFVIVLVCISTFMHAGWNLLARYHRSEAVFSQRMLIITVAVGFIPAVASELHTASLPGKAWFCLVCSGISCGLYYYFLVRSYHSSDFTIVYPVARSLPVLFVAIGDVLRGRPLAMLCWAGMALVVSGCFLAPLQSFRDVSLARYIRKSNVWIVLTALGTVGYSMFDKVASEVVMQGPATAARYGYMFFLVSCIVYCVTIKLFAVDRSNAQAVGWLSPAVAGFLNFGAYWLVLWAYQMSRHVSSIVAFRQLSVVIGVVLAFALYRERGFVVRITGSLLITSGLVLIGLFGG